MSRVAAVRTKFSPDELLAALDTAYTDELGEHPTRETLAVLAAQVALETANGQSCVCWNVGNFKWYSDQTDCCQFMTTEWIGDPPKPVSLECMFAAFPSLGEGVRAYVHKLWTHWDVAWHSVVAGNPEQFAAGLRQQHYYTAPLEQYAAGMRRWFDYYSARLRGDDSVTRPVVRPPSLAPGAPDVTPDEPGTEDDPDASG